MTNINLDKIKNVHFIGIGGIGISALAQLAYYEGKVVSGIENYLKEDIAGGSTLITMGAGDIYKVGEKLVVI